MSNSNKTTRNKQNENQMTGFICKAEKIANNRIPDKLPERSYAYAESLGKLRNNIPIACPRGIITNEINKNMINTTIGIGS